MLLFEAISRFRLHPDLNPEHYHITATMRDNSKWRAITHMGDDRYPMGEMAEVGYVMISLVDNTIIPISRGDEHHRGHDLLYDLTTGRYPYGKRSKKININPQDYYPMWYTGQSYLYHKREADLLRRAAERFLQYGGPDGMVQLRQDFPDQRLHLSDFIASNGQGVVVEKGELAPAGKRLYDMFITLGNEFVNLPEHPDGIQKSKIFLNSAKLIRHCLKMTYDLGLDIGEVRQLLDDIKASQKMGSVKTLERQMFGFHGLKFMVHATLKNPESWRVDNSKAFWGDLDYAKELFDQM